MAYEITAALTTGMAMAATHTLGRNIIATLATGMYLTVDAISDWRKLTLRTRSFYQTLRRRHFALDLLARSLGLTINRRGNS